MKVNISGVGNSSTAPTATANNIQDVSNNSQAVVMGLQQCFSQLYLHSLEIQALNKHLQVRPSTPQQHNPPQTAATTAAAAYYYYPQHPPPLPLPLPLPPHIPAVLPQQQPQQQQQSYPNYWQNQPHNPFL